MAAMKAPHPCQSPSCPNLVASGSYCEEHKRNEDTRASSRERGYTHTWEKVRARKLAQSPICEDCLAADVVKPAEMVHHLDGNPRNNRMDNLCSICRDHHAKRHGKKIKHDA